MPESCGDFFLFMFIIIIIFIIVTGKGLCRFSFHPYLLRLRLLPKSRFRYHPLPFRSPRESDSLPLEYVSYLLPGEATEFCVVTADDDGFGGYVFSVQGGDGVDDVLVCGCW